MNAMKFVNWDWFERLIMLLIVAGTLSMVMKDYTGEHDEWNAVLAKVDDFITLAFVIEAIFKIIAYGFIWGQHTYFRDGWNILDFIIVISSLGSNKYRLVRIVRVLKPLRSLSRIPVLKK